MVVGLVREHVRIRDCVQPPAVRSVAALNPTLRHDTRPQAHLVCNGPAQFRVEKILVNVINRANGRIDSFHEMCRFTTGNNEKVSIPLCRLPPAPLQMTEKRFTAHSQPIDTCLRAIDLLLDY